MARGRKSLSLNEKLEKITKDIANMENSLEELKKTKNEIEEQIRQARLSELDNLITEKGLSYEEVIEMLNKE